MRLPVLHSNPESHAQLPINLGHLEPVETLSSGKLIKAIVEGNATIIDASLILDTCRRPHRSPGRTGLFRRYRHAGRRPARLSGKRQTQPEIARSNAGKKSVPSAALVPLATRYLTQSRYPDSGVRDFEAVNQLAASHGLELLRDIAMPSNNRMLAGPRRRANPVDDACRESKYSV